MASSKIYVDYDNLESCITQLETLKEEYRAAYTNTLYGNVMESVKTAYSGTDCDTFVTKVEGFRNDFARLTEIIGEYIDFLKKAKNDYMNTQENLTQLAKQLKGDMN